MESSGAVEESLDFDFFETPRSPGNNVSTPPRSEKSPAKENSLKPSTSGNLLNRTFDKDDDKKPPKPSAKSDKRDSSPEYSTDTLSESEDSDSAEDKSYSKDRKKSYSNKHSARRSSLSSSSRSRSRSPSLSPSDSDRSKSPRERDRSNNHKRDKSPSSNSIERPGNPVAKVRRTPDKGRSSPMPKRGRSRQGEDEYSSSAYSDDNTNSVSTAQKSDSYRGYGRESRGPEKASKKQAWGTEAPREDRHQDSKGNRKSYERPKTAKVRSNKGSDRKGASRKHSDTETLSDSDMTDVSPMDSPRHNNTQGSKTISGRRIRTEAGSGSGVKIQYKAMPVKDIDVAENEEDPDRQTSGLDLEILMKAVGELEKQKRLQENSRRVMFAPMTLKRGDKANYTFDRDQTRNIERENQRLLREIVRRVHSGDQKKTYYRQPTPQFKMTASAVNREREMRRIEADNLAFLKRLQKVKPTSTISRDNQLRSYEKTTLHGVPISALHPLPGKARSRAGSSMADDTSSLGSRTRSMTSINSGVSSVRSVASKRGSRPTSATKRPGSATSTGSRQRIDSRPQWSDRW